jgi:O-antigen/teichoic acid export membrane protein
MIYTRIDSVMVERIHVNGKAEAGYYAQGFRLLNALFMFAMIFSNLLFPIFSKMFKQKENVIPMLAMSSKLLIGGALLIALISFFNSEFILSIIYKNDIFISAQSFKYIMLSFVGMCATLIFGTLLTARGDLKFLNITSAIGILINIIINLILIPKYGAVGASIATVVTQTLVSIVQINHCFKTLSVRLSMKQSFLFTSYVILLIVVLYYIPIDSVSMLLLSILSGLILMFVFQLIQLKVLKQLFLPIKKIK